MDGHLREIERLNQRGGRMLSIVDLLEAGTLAPELAAVLLAAIGAGASFMVGARPGGAGKTTVMGALLNFVPRDAELAPADGVPAIAHGLANPRPRRCYICHEIGRGGYYAYLWGEPLRAFFRLRRAGHMLATNLHADTLEEAREQVCGGSGVPEEDFRGMNLALFLEYDGITGMREITEGWYSDGTAPHKCFYDRGELALPTPLVTPERADEARRLLDALLATEARTVGEVRAFLERSP